jgi:predicted membrane channel-forming protein YqfA (hemolysin III family)
MKEYIKSDIKCNQTQKPSYKRLCGFILLIALIVYAFIGMFIITLNTEVVWAFSGIIMFSMGATIYEHGRALKK